MTAAMRRYAAFVSLLWRSSRKWTLASLLASLAAGLLPAVTMISSGVLVGSIAGLAADGLSSAAGHRAVAGLVVFGVSTALYAIAEPAMSISNELLTARYVVTVDDLLVSASLGPDRIEHLEDQSTARRIGAAIEAGREGLHLQGPTCGFQVLHFRLSGLATAGLLFTFRWWAPLVLAAGWIVFGRTISAWVKTLFDELLQVTGSDRRRAEYLRGALHGQRAAKEIRIFGLGGWLLDHYRGVWLSAMRVVWENRARASRQIFFGIAAMTLANSLVIGFLAHDAFTGSVSSGELVTFAQAILGTVGLGLIGDPQWIVGRAARTAEHIRDLARQFGGETPAATANPAADRPAGIELRNVRFTYPHRDQPTLDGLDLVVPAGQSIAVVGINGAGKSTLIKLLTGLYSPDSGTVRVGGIDSVQGDLEALRRRVAVVFQEFLRYELPLRDNVGFGDRAADQDLLDAALQDAGGTAVLDRLDGNWETVLSAAYHGGTDLSGGQWQRVALARALTAVHSGAGVLILDEPTAALDVRAEVELFERLLSVVSGVTTVLVSHRLSSVRHADRIVVVDGGRIAEDGTHAELMDAGGLYAQMFSMQAERFDDTGDVDGEQVPADA